MSLNQSPADPSPIAPIQSDHVASFYKAAGDPLRLDILRVLKQDSFAVQELATIFSMVQPGMSHHLKVMATAGLLETRRQGNSIFYRRALARDDSQLGMMRANLYAVIDALPVNSTYQEIINTIYLKRSKRSQTFFEKNAKQFLKSQGLLCELGQYLANMQELLDLTKLPKSARVMEVGPGHGEFLRELSGRYGDLVALDNSEEILGLAKEQLANKAGKVEFVKESLESYTLPTHKRPFDAVILNMVLHHMPSPANVFPKTYDLITPKGFLLIADLASHDQDWVKESCGDLWQGFDAEDLDDWAVDAGFSEKQSLYLGLKNGFQIQLKLFQKD